ncbi:MAG TPA: hypothetical protein PKX92_05255 [Edaphocola sp.]|nr:hypothetical protein [Edaphocola sp.]
MRKTTVIILVSALLTTACNTSKQKPNMEKTDAISENTISKEKNIPFKIAGNYFIKNDVKGTVPSKISTQAEFNTYFGMAATMGETGKPTPIDFSKEYVITVDYNTTNKETELKPVSLVKKGEDIVFNYSVSEGEEAGFSLRPFLMLIVDNNNQGKVILKKVQ